MTFKPIPVKQFEKRLKRLGFSWKKGGIDWNVYDADGIFVCSVKINHPGENVVSATSVQKFDRKLKERDME